MAYYAQNGEDRFMSEYYYKHFKEDNIKPTILDLGANDGKTLSNSLHFIELNWKATLVEASPNTFKKLEALHKGNKNVCCINKGIADKPCTLRFHESGALLGTGDESLVSTFDKRELSRWGGKVKFTEGVVECLDYKGILKLSKFKSFDIISIDIEGLETLVLPQIDLTDTKILCIEFNSKPELKAEFTNYAAKFGMKLIHQNLENLIFAK